VVAVDEKFRNRNITLKLNIKSEASDGNVVMNVTDETNAVALVTSEALPVSNEVGGAVGFVTFNIPENCLSLSYEVVALPEAGLPETIVDDIIAELSVVSLLTTSVEVPIVTEWRSYTPTFQGFGTPSAVEFRWRQVGESVEIEGTFLTGTTAAVEARVGLPNALLVGGIAGIKNVGLVARDIDPSQAWYALAQNNNTYLTISATGGENPLVGLDGSALVVSSGVKLTLQATVPAQGLTATKASSIPLAQSVIVEEADSELYAEGNAAESITANVTDIPFILQSNIGDAIVWNGNRFEVTKSGIYDITGMVGFSASLPRVVRLYEDGVAIREMSFQPDSPHVINSSIKLELGKVYSIRVDINGGTLANNSRHNLNITYQGSLKQLNPNPNSKITIPTSELRMEGASSRGSTATAIVRFDNVAKLRGDAFEVLSDATLGTRIVMKKKGKLSVTATLFTGANYLYLTRDKSVLTTAVGTASENLASGGTGAANFYSNLAWYGDVQFGDTLRLSSGGNPSADQVNSLNLSFQEQDISVSVTNTLPQFSDSDSSIRLDTANGYGSVGTKIRRFSNIRDNIGTDIEYIDSATDGASFVVKSAGVYHVSYTDEFNVASALGISKNASSLTAIVADLPKSETLAQSSTAGVNFSTSASWQGQLEVGDIIRAHTFGAATGATNRCHFTISKVGKPNVTGVDVTPFVNIPQPESQSSEGFLASRSASGIIPIPQTTQRGNGIYVYNTSTGQYTITKPCQISLTFSLTANDGTGGPSAQIFRNGVSVSANLTRQTTGADGSSTWVGHANVGDVFDFRTGTSGAQINLKSSVLATALSDQILTAPESFSTDSANLTYAPSSLYTLSTLKDAPVGTFITFTYGASSNNRTQTTTAPTQSTADMNVNGIRLQGRGFTQGNSPDTPSAFAIQIGKGLKGTSLNLYKNVGKEIGGSLDYAFDGISGAYGAHIKAYNEETGILYIDTGLQINTAVGFNTFGFSDATNQNFGYLVVNASKSPALTGVPLLNRGSNFKSTPSAAGLHPSVQGGVEEVTGDTWDGKIVYRRCYEMVSDITTSVTLHTIDSGLSLVDSFNYLGAFWMILNNTVGGNSNYAYYNESTGEVATVCQGGFGLLTGSRFCIRYTKD
jgi:hypothetical protein